MTNWKKNIWQCCRRWLWRITIINFLVVVIWGLLIKPGKSLDRSVSHWQTTADGRVYYLLGLGLGGRYLPAAIAYHTPTIECQLIDIIKYCWSLEGTYVICFHSKFSPTPKRAPYTYRLGIYILNVKMIDDYVIYRGSNIEKNRTARRPKKKFFSYYS